MLSCLDNMVQEAKNSSKLSLADAQDVRDFIMESISKCPSGDMIKKPDVLPVSESQWDEVAISKALAQFSVALSVLENAEVYIPTKYRKYL